MYGDESVPRFSRKMLVRLLHERGVLPDYLHAKIRELRRLTASRIVCGKVRIKQCQGIFQDRVTVGRQGARCGSLIHRPQSDGSHNRQ